MGFKNMSEGKSLDVGAEVTRMASELSNLSQYWKQLRADANAEECANSVDGIPWHEAPLPSRFHVCRPQTRGYVGLFDVVERCACGAIRNPRFGGRWLEKNDRRKRDAK